MGFTKGFKREGAEAWPGGTEIVLTESFESTKHISSPMNMADGSTEWRTVICSICGLQSVLCLFCSLTFHCLLVGVQALYLRSALHSAPLQSFKGYLRATTIRRQRDKQQKKIGLSPVYEDHFYLGAGLRCTPGSFTSTPINWQNHTVIVVGRYLWRSHTPTICSK